MIAGSALKVVNRRAVHTCVHSELAARSNSFRRRLVTVV